MNSSLRIGKEGREQPHGIVGGERLTMDKLLGNITITSALMIFCANEAGG
jgi:hypothetical protein